MTRRALICGVSGQDGAYLAQHLLNNNYKVVGTSRDAELSRFDNLRRLGIFEQLRCRSMALNDFRSVLTVLSEEEPDEVYNLAGQSSVGLSFEQPVETMESIATACLNLLEAIRFLGRRIRLYNASSSECFGDTLGVAADEQTPFRPRSPYAVAKAAGHWTVVNYREAYDLFACNGILFNHESPLRPTRFVTKKIVAGACAIRRGETTRLQLGNMDISRDWGSAREYVIAMHRMLQLDRATDLVIATGHTHTLQEFVATAFAAVALDWRKHVDVNSSLRRPSDITRSAANPTLAEQRIGWKATHLMPDVVKDMVNAELADAGGLAGVDR